MCGLKSYDKMHETISYSLSTGGGITLPYDSTIDSLNDLNFIINFIDTGLKGLYYDYVCLFLLYQ